jgi:Flp pilus assembly protein protease CpaA
MLWVPLALVIILCIAAYQDLLNYEINPWTWYPSVFILPYTLMLWLESPPGIVQVLFLAGLITCFIIPYIRHYIGGADLAALTLVTGMYPHPAFVLFLLVTGLMVAGWSIITTENRIPGVVPITLGFIISLIVV